MIQPVLFDFMKKIMPMFIQGLTKKQMKNLLKSKLKSHWKSVSKDGSAF
jgi:flagellar motor component MotA